MSEPHIWKRSRSSSQSQPRFLEALGQSVGWMGGRFEREREREGEREGGRESVFLKRGLRRKEVLLKVLETFKV